jgi:N-acetylmuramoyl-L-alanine amidase
MVGKIIIDPGHGGKDNGAVWGYAEEDDINLIVSFLLRCELRNNYHDHIVMSREKDEFVDLSDRVLLANFNHADLFVSIHCDAYHNTTTKGISTHIHPDAEEDTLEIATDIQEALIDEFPDHVNRGIRFSNFYVLRKTQMPAVLIECEFLSNPDMRRFLREPENQLALAQAIAKGIG